MARLLADEDFHQRVADELVLRGHDVLTARAAGLSGFVDPDVLAAAIALGRGVLTHNRRHFIRLHAVTRPHAGIVVCTRDDTDPIGLAGRIHAAIGGLASFADMLIRVNRPPGPAATP